MKDINIRQQVDNLEIQLELPLKWPEVEVDGIVDEKRNIRYWGKATLRPNGKWVCLADVAGCLCIVEVKITSKA
jgi:hypothetical protein